MQGFVTKYVLPLIALSLLVFAVMFVGGQDRAAAPAPPVIPPPQSPFDYTVAGAGLVEAQTEVQPASGRRMLRFVGADYAGKPNPGGYIGDIYRLIDVRGYRPELASGDAVVQVSARFNAAPFPDDQTYRCSISLFAFDQATAIDNSSQAIPTLIDRALATTRRSNDLLDHDSHTWQKVSADLRLPPDTDFLLLRIAIGHGNATRKSPGHETFAAHFADGVQVSLTRRPPLQ